MPVELVGYGFLQPGGKAPVCHLHKVSAEVAGYLVDHINDLTRRATASDAAPARFRRQPARDRFESLTSGNDKTFLDAAQQLATSLHTAMDQRSKRGFFVAIRERTGRSQIRVAALKLDVHDEHAAAARQVGDELELEAVQDLLDIPGELQKGAVYPDDRPHSEVIIGDKFERTALYFLRALEVQQIENAAPAVTALIQVVGDVAPERLDRLVAAIERLEEPISPTAFLDAEPDLLPPEMRTAVLERLAERQRPIEEIDPRRHPPRRVLRASGIRIEGLASDVNQRVRVERQGDAWVITIRVNEEPEVSYK